AGVDTKRASSRNVSRSGAFRRARLAAANRSRVASRSAPIAQRHQLRQRLPPRLLDPPHYRLSCPSDRRSRVGILEFIRGKGSDISFLLLSLGVRVRTSLNLKNQGLVADRICTGIAKASLYDRFVFLRGSPVTVVSREFGAVRTREQISKAAIAIE